MAHGLLGILRHQLLELALGALMVGVGALGVPKQPREFRPGIEGIRVHDADGFDPRLWGRATLIPGYQCYNWDGRDK
jgi:hypothetical protein